ncbi:MAG TPA: winged helix-turn-helix domain-containing protein [Candidatus Acidoferrum sp.]|nr:winged helix-turn-helix domain-containing protein [Candidatus Acidoferrum sp.]
MLSVAQRRLWHAGSRVALKPKEAELLVLLAERRPRTISKDEIIERLWRGAAASDAALTQTVYRLRRTLGKYATERDFIRTIPGIGFQFAGGSPIESRSEQLDALRPAFSLYQRAVSQYRKRTEASILIAIRLLENVRTEDPDYMPALVMQAKAYTNAGIRLLLPPQDAYWLARRTLQRVLDRDPANADALATLSTLLLFFNGDRDAAHRAAERALLLSPQTPPAHKAAIWERLSRGDFAAALTQADFAVRSGPASQQSTALLGTVLYMAQRYAEAYACFETARTLGPLDTTARFYEACAYVMTGAYDRAEELLNAMTGTDMLTRVIGARGYIAAKRGNAPASTRALEDLAAAHAPSDISRCVVHLARGEHASAAAALERAMRTREPGLFLVTIDPMYGALHANHRELVTLVQRGRPPRCDSCAIEIRTPDNDGSFDCSLCAQCQSTLPDC